LRRSWLASLRPLLAWAACASAVFDHKLRPRRWSGSLGRWSRLPRFGGALQRCSVGFVSVPCGVPDGIPALPARLALVHGSRKRSYGQADSGASHEVFFPFSACSPRCAVRGCRPPDDPASALGWHTYCFIGSVRNDEVHRQLAHAVFRRPSTLAATVGC